MYLALDQSPSKVGFAYGEPGQTPGSGVFKLDGGLWELRNWLTLMINSKGVYRVGYEAPFVGPQTRHDTLFKLCELPAIIKLVCQDTQTFVEAVPPPTWRKHFIGIGQRKRVKGGQANSAWWKDQSLIACNERGWEIVSHDEADALGILDLA